jgi:glycosyltransferase involved in cell wall biosynthesis
VRAAVRRLLRPWRFPILETRNRILGIHAERRNLRFQRAEALRLQRLIGEPRPQACAVVVIPTYMRPDGLVKAIHSVLAQTFTDFVVIVVDDGGGLPELPEDPRLVAVSLSRNTATLGMVRNLGIGLAESEFIAFLDDDNVWTPDHLAIAVAALEADPGLTAVYTSVRRLWPDGTELDVLDKPFSRRRLRQEPFVDANSIVVRRSSNCGYSVLPRGKKTHPKEDWEYVWRLSRRGRIAHLSKVTVLYAINPGSYFTTWIDDDGKELQSVDPAAPDTQ